MSDAQTPNQPQATRNYSPLLISEPPLQVLPSLAVRIGLNEAIVLQQLHYWLLRENAPEREGRKWSFNTYKDWQKKCFPFWSVSTIKRTFLNLEKQRLIIAAQFEAGDWEQRKWYTINYDELNEKGVSPGEPTGGNPDDEQETGEPFDETNLIPSNRPNLTPSNSSKRAAVIKKTQLEDSATPTHSAQTTTTDQNAKSSVGVSRKIAGQTDQAKEGNRVIQNGRPEHSRYTLDECRTYAEHLRVSGQGITNPTGYAKTIYRTGEDDSQIAAFLSSRQQQAAEKLPPNVDASRCPDCDGTGYFYPEGIMKGVARCRHPNLKNPPKALGSPQRHAEAAS